MWKNEDKMKIWCHCRRTCRGAVEVGLSVRYTECAEDTRALDFHQCSGSAMLCEKWLALKVGRFVAAERGRVC